MAWKYCETYLRLHAVSLRRSARSGVGIFYDTAISYCSFIGLSWPQHQSPMFA